MNKNIGMQAISMFLAVLLVSVAMMPVVSAQSECETIQFGDSIDSVFHFNPPEIEIIENTSTSSIVQVNDVLISLKSNPEHSEAILTIEDTKTNETECVHYKVSKKASKYNVDVYYAGELVNQWVTEYDPFESGNTKKIFEDSREYQNSVVDTPYLPDTTSIHATNYWWDGVYFVKGSGIKYPHPNCQYYGIETWDSKYVSGDALNHRHFDKDTSQTIAGLGPVAAGAAIGAYIGTVPGAVIGAVLGAALGGASCAVLSDETDCIWVFEAQSWELIFVPVPPTYFHWLPNYFRVSDFTLWDSPGVGNP